MNIEIANRLQQLRKEKGLSQEQLADALGISRQAVSKWERAESSPDTDNLICLAKLYEVSLDDLLNTDESIEEIIEAGKPLESDDEITKVDDLEEESSKSRIVSALTGASVFLVVISFFILGFLGWWHPGWIVFLLIPIFVTLIEAIADKDISKFAYPVLVTAAYLLVGSIWGWWHPGWISFLTIPLYYTIIDAFKKKK